MQRPDFLGEESKLGLHFLKIAVIPFTIFDGNDIAKLVVDM